MKIRKRLTSAIVMFAVLFMATAAPSCNEATIRTAIDASYRLPAAGDKFTDQIRAGRDAGIVAIETSKQFGNILEPVAKACVVYVQMVKAAEKLFNETGQFSSATQKELRDYFDLNIIEPFIRSFELIGIISGPTGDAIILAAVAVRVILKKIAKGVGSKKAIPEIKGADNAVSRNLYKGVDKWQYS